LTLGHNGMEANRVAQISRERVRASAVGPAPESL
jgi:hypothetical protein